MKRGGKLPAKQPSRGEETGKGFAASPFSQRTGKRKFAKLCVGPLWFPQTKFMEIDTNFNYYIRGNYHVFLFVKSRSPSPPRSTSRLGGSSGRVLSPSSLLHILTPTHDRPTNPHPPLSPPPLHFIKLPVRRGGGRGANRHRLRLRRFRFRRRRRRRFEKWREVVHSGGTVKGIGKAISHFYTCLFGGRNSR